MQEKLVFRNEEEYNCYIRKALEESECEAADPNVRKIPLEEFLKEAEAYLYALERRRTPKSA